jgi:hypothetical protein
VNRVNLLTHIVPTSESYTKLSLYKYKSSSLVLSLKTIIKPSILSAKKQNRNHHKAQYSDLPLPSRSHRCSPPKRPITFSHVRGLSLTPTSRRSSGLSTINANYREKGSRAWYNCYYSRMLFPGCPCGGMGLL